MQSLVLQLGTLLVRSEVTLGRLAHVPFVQVETTTAAATSEASPTMLDLPKELAVDFTDEGADCLFWPMLSSFSGF